MQKRVDIFAEEMKHLAASLQIEAFQSIIPGIGIGGIKNKGTIGPLGQAPVDHRYELDEGVRQKIFSEIREKKPDLVPNQVVVATTAPAPVFQRDPHREWHNNFKELRNAVQRGAFSDGPRRLPRKTAKWQPFAFDTSLVLLSTFFAWVAASSLWDRDIGDALAQKNAFLRVLAVLSPGQPGALKTYAIAGFFYILGHVAYWLVFRIGMGMTMGDLLFGQKHASQFAKHQSRSGM